VMVSRQYLKMETVEMISGQGPEPRTIVMILQPYLKILMVPQQHLKMEKVEMIAEQDTEPPLASC